MKLTKEQEYVVMVALSTMMSERHAVSWKMRKDQWKIADVLCDEMLARFNDEALRESETK